MTSPWSDRWIDRDDLISIWPAADELFPEEAVPDVDLPWTEEGGELVHDYYLSRHPLELLITTATAQCKAYAPAIPTMDQQPGYQLPNNYVVACAMQVRNLYNATKVDSGTYSVGDGEQSYAPHPLDWQVTELLRPRRGKPMIG